jgi:hypothetical protein
MSAKNHEEVTPLGITPTTENNNKNAGSYDSPSTSTVEAEAEAEPRIFNNNSSSEAGISARLGRVYDKLSYTPQRCRYSAAQPFEFSLALNVLFGKPCLAVTIYQLDTFYLSPLTS